MIQIYYVPIFLIYLPRLFKTISVIHKVRYLEDFPALEIKVQAVPYTI